MAIASIHLVRDSRRSALLRIPLERRQLASSGASWVRVLGTGRDGRLAHSFDPCRRAVVAIWPDAAAFDDFVTGHPLHARWAAADEYWFARLHLVGAHGAWGGVDPLADLVVEAGWPGPVVTLTRATIRCRALRTFTRHARAVTASLGGVEGLRCVVGVGDVPVLRLGTLAVWEHEDAVRSSIAGWGEHDDARRAAERDDWFAESLFARFAPVDSFGRWGAADPVVDQR